VPSIATMAKCAEEAQTWIPKSAIHYLEHTVTGQSLREIARATGCHASTVMRRVRRCENLRDDPLVDGALDRLGARRPHIADAPFQSEGPLNMTANNAARITAEDDPQMAGKALRALRRMAESGAVMAVAKDMEKAVVVRDLPGGASTPTTVVDREVAEVLALNEWISGEAFGRVARYRITGMGRSALKRLIAEIDGQGMAEDAQPFAAQHRDMTGDSGAHRSRYNLAESPLAALARRRDKSGQPFLPDDLVAVGERLREDFELSQMGPRVAQNWESFLTGPAASRSTAQGDTRSDSAEAARARVRDALSDLGPGLGDVALRCCCFLEGIETTEKKMGWSARSGKIVLRIALQRLKRHYEDRHGKFGPMIG